MNKSESKYFNTANRMDEAMIKLLDRKDFEYITVKEICEEAKVNRSTFYLHYDNTRDLLVECTEYMNRQFLTYFKNGKSSAVFNIENSSKEELILIKSEYLVPYLTYVKENARVFKTSISKSVSMILDESYQKMFKYIFNPIMDKFKVPNEKRKYIVAFHINGIIAIIMEWIKNDCDMSIDDITQIIIDCVVPKEWR